MRVDIAYRIDNFELRLDQSSTVRSFLRFEQGWAVDVTCMSCSLMGVFALFGWLLIGLVTRSRCCTMTTTSLRLAAMHVMNTMGFLRGEGSMETEAIKVFSHL